MTTRGGEVGVHYMRSERRRVRILNAIRIRQRAHVVEGREFVDDGELDHWDHPRRQRSRAVYS
jgi:hypothetical protein